MIALDLYMSTSRQVGRVWPQLRSDTQKNISLAIDANRKNVPPFGFSFSEFSVEENRSFPNCFRSKFSSQLAHKVAEKLLRCNSGRKFRSNFTRSHFPTSSAFLRLYGNFVVFQSMAPFLSIRSLFKGWILGWHKPTSEQQGPTVNRFLETTLLSLLIICT